MNKKKAFLILLISLIALVVIFTFLYLSKNKQVNEINIQPGATGVVPQPLTREEVKQASINLLENVNQQINASSTLLNERQENKVQADILVEKVNQQVDASPALESERQALQAQALKLLEQTSQQLNKIK